MSTEHNNIITSLGIEYAIYTRLLFWATVYIIMRYSDVVVELNIKARRHVGSVLSDGQRVCYNANV